MLASGSGWADFVASGGSTSGDIMFWWKPRDPGDGEIVSPSDTSFSGQEDGSITERRRRRERKRLIRTTCVGAALALRCDLSIALARTLRLSIGVSPSVTAGPTSGTSFYLPLRAGLTFLL